MHDLNKPQISIIIPVFNVVKYIERCLDSIAKQSFESFEVILVDDGSSDGSETVCDKYSSQDSRFKVFHKKNEGVSVARNLGLKQASGSWITFCDSDDYLPPNALELYSLHFNNGDLIKGGFEQVFLSKKESKSFRVPSKSVLSSKSEILSLAESSHYCGFVWNSCIRKDIAMQFAFDEKINWCEDQLYVFQCMLVAKKIVFLSEIVYYYRVNDLVSLGQGSSLSSHLIEPDVIKDVADEEFRIKRGFCDGNVDISNLIFLTKKSKYLFALRNAFLKCGFIKSFFYGVNKLNIAIHEVFFYIAKMQIKRFLGKI